MGKVNQIFMLMIYNILQILLGVALSPFLLLVILLTPKYREMVWRRSAGGISSATRALPDKGSRIWVHALSVGEVSSARALIRAIRREYPDGILIFSASTRSGLAYADSVLSGDIDLLVPFPFDLYWIVERFIRFLRPDLFVLVETDLWPNFLASLGRHQVNAFLVNGRVSESSAAKYQRFRSFFTPLFNVFNRVSMQTARDVERMKELGVDEERLLALGNLKYGMVDLPIVEESSDGGPIPEGRPVLVAGSTHPGEEEIVIDVFKRLQVTFPDLFLVIAPRDIARGREIAGIACDRGIEAVQRSIDDCRVADLLILDTLGELAGIYSKCHAAFVGGSLVMAGGHNPLEPAFFGKPVIFGPHMEDFSEVAEDLLKVGGAATVSDRDTMKEILEKWLTDDRLRLETGAYGAGLVREQEEVTARHLDLIKEAMSGGN
jgi:3-deoxy-D-manno-octulosonic-acid transferase